MGEKEWEETMPLRLALTAMLDKRELYAQGYLYGIRFAATRIRMRDTIQEALLAIQYLRELDEHNMSDVDRGSYYEGSVRGLTVAIEAIRAEGKEHGTTLLDE